ncbi:MAG: HK97 gp10 family phage protein [Eubacteriales bacterium]|nr:HK97 gp10 family phage protein [Eubacteriales bacterium]
MGSSIQIDDLADEINRLVSDYGDHCAETTKDCVRKVAKKTLQRIKQEAPKKTGKYKKGWKKTTVKENSSCLVVAIHDTKYSLVHLLEKGHQKRGGGRVPPIEHVAPAEQAAIAELEQEIISKI